MQNLMTPATQAGSSQVDPSTTWDAIVVGGGPSGAVAAADLARAGHQVLLLDRAGRIKPCGGAIPPILVREFGIPDSLIVARATGARIVAPSLKEADMPIPAAEAGPGGGPADSGYVGMVDRETFDEWLRDRAVAAGATRVNGTFEAVERDPDGVAVVCYAPKDGGAPVRARARAIVGADGAKSQVARQCVKGWQRVKYVFAYHEIVEVPEGYDGSRCDVYYQGHLSPDFYAWIFPHGKVASIGTGSAQKGFGLRGAVGALRKTAGLDGMRTVRREGAPIPLRPMRKWDNGRDVVLAGDAAGVVAPASGEGIYYAMLGGRLAAEAVVKLHATGDVRSLQHARARFMKAHGKVFFILGIMQAFWYSSDKRREKFVKMCRDKDVQRLTWEAYMNKALVRRDPMAHVRIFFKDLAQLVGLARA